MIISQWENEKSHCAPEEVLVVPQMTLARFALDN